MPPGAATPQSAWPEPRLGLRCPALTSPWLSGLPWGFPPRPTSGGAGGPESPCRAEQSRAKVEVGGLRSVRPNVHATQNHRPRVRALGVNIQPQAALGLGSTACVCSPPRTSLGAPQLLLCFLRGTHPSIPVFSGWSPVWPISGGQVEAGERE